MSDFSKNVLVQNLSYCNKKYYRYILIKYYSINIIEFDFHENESVCETHFHLMVLLNNVFSHRCKGQVRNGVLYEIIIIKAYA